MKFLAAILLALACGAWGQQPVPSRSAKPPMSYEVEVPPVPGAPPQATLEVSHIRGRAHDDAGSPIATVGLGLFTADASHKFVAMVVSDNEGKFDFGKAIPAGSYRLVAKYPGSCTANIPIILGRHAHHSKIDLTMEYPGLDLCSSARVR